MSLSDFWSAFRSTGTIRRSGRPTAIPMLMSRLRSMRPSAHEALTSGNFVNASATALTTRSLRLIASDLSTASLNIWRRRTASSIAISEVT